MNIRLLRNNEYDKALNLYEKVFNKKQITKYELNDSNAYFIVAEIDNNIVGLVQLDIIIDVFGGFKYGYVNSVCVDENYRKNGIGTKLMNMVTEICEKEKCKHIELTSSNNKKAAHQLYFKLGYEIRDTNVFRKKL